MDHSIRILGESKPMTRVFEQVSRAAPLDRPILVVGERGTGKELIAARLHYHLGGGTGLTSKSTVVPLARAYWSRSYSATRLVHSLRYKRQLGRFERAHGGSLFLDELGNLPSPLKSECCGSSSMENSRSGWSNTHPDRHPADPRPTSTYGPCNRWRFSRRPS